MIIKENIASNSISHLIVTELVHVKENVILVCLDDDEAKIVYSQLSFFAPKNIKKFLLLNQQDKSHEGMTRASTLALMSITKSQKFLVVTLDNLLTYNKFFPSYKEKIKFLTINQLIQLHEFSHYLTDCGFIRQDSFTPKLGEFSIKGGILEIALEDAVYRVTVGWDKVESIKKYDYLTSKLVAELNELVLYPVLDSKAMKEEDNSSNIVAYLDSPENTNIMVFDSLLLRYTESRIKHLSNLNNYKYYKSAEELERSLFSYTKKNLMVAYSISKKIDFKKSTDESNNDSIFDFIKSSTRSDTTIICASTKNNVRRIEKLLYVEDITSQVIDNVSAAKGGIVNIAYCPIKESFNNKNQVFISDKELFPKSEEKPISASKKFKNILYGLENFSEGDFVVHEEHGIAKFLGVELINIQNHKRDCVKLVYADDARLYVPVENIGILKKYGEEYAVLDKLGGLGWKRRTSKVKEKITDIANKIVSISAQRKLSASVPLELDKNAYEKFCLNFPYVETEDQLSACDDVMKDLLSGRPMDRLICGDVGFGKTEVAMRASFITSRGCYRRRQALMITSTTLLCRQHYYSFIKRFEGTDIRIAQISRLVSKSEVKKIKEKLKVGEVDIIIGTHALLAKDIEFCDLGLVIIDEEQHFGVAQKERLKALNSEVNVLLMSATPIPRTLQVSLAGLQDVSFISTPPVSRLPVITFIENHNQEVVKEALLREYRRNGQVFYVCARISSLETIEKLLKNIVPEMSYVVAHGQMPPNIIEKIINDFYEKKYDILISTTIVESGLDIPSANTMIIHQAEDFGLAQLYQLRGRVGRGKVQGYACLMLGKNKLTKYSYKRLEILEKASALGSGFLIASHDMDIRGFGNLLGKEQSGNIREVGIELYQEMLEEEIAKLQNSNQIADTSWTPNINLGMEIYIPENFVPQQEDRMQLYRRLALIEYEEDVWNLVSDLENKYGDLPQPTKNLCDVVRLKILCKSLNIASVDLRSEGVLISFRQDVDVSKEVMAFIDRYPGTAKIKPESKLKLKLKNISPIEEIRKILEELKIIKRSLN